MIGLKRLVPLPSRSYAIVELQYHPARFPALALLPNSLLDVCENLETVFQYIEIEQEYL